MEKAASERVGSVPHEIWDVHATSGRWWVITNPTNLYAQDAFPSRDEALTFHVGLAVRMITYNDPSVIPPVSALLPAARRRWDQASEALGPAREAEDYQAIGVRLRECLVSLIGEITNDDLVPEDNDRPHAADFKAWFALFADSVAAGSSSTKLRSYLKNTSREAWEYVNWLTHAKNAAHFDAEIGVAITNDLLNAVRIFPAPAAGHSGHRAPQGRWRHPTLEPRRCRGRVLKGAAQLHSRLWQQQGAPG